MFITYLRKLLGEDVQKPYQPNLIGMKSRIYMNGKMVGTRDVAVLVSKTGYPESCNFRPTALQFEGKISRPYYTPQQTHDLIVKYMEKYENPVLISVCEPTIEVKAIYL